MTVERELMTLRSLPYGTARIAATEAIARRVEAEGPAEHLATALLELVEAYTFADEGAKSFVVFARLLRLWDRSPELFDADDQRNLFWEFKWIAGDVAEFPQITHAQAEAFLRDMERRFELAGHGLSSVRMSRFRWAWHVGDPGAEAARMTWTTGARDEFEDCTACIIGQQVDFFVESGRYDEAVALGLTQRFDCNLEPTRTRYALAYAALMTGDTELSRSSLAGAFASDDGAATDFGPARGKGFETLARGGDLEWALRMLRNDHAALLCGGSSPLYRLRFLLSVLAGLSANAEFAERDTGFRESEWRTVADLSAWVLGECRALTALFDPRNGNNHYADAIDRAARATLTSTPLRFGVGDSANVPELGVGSGAGVASTPGSASRTASPKASLAIATTGTDDFAEAERHAAAQRYSAAAASYIAAAAMLEAEGWLERAGLSYAEAAQCAALDGNDPVSHQYFAEAVPRLRAGGGDPSAIAAVLAAWAPIASRMDDSGQQVAETAAELDRIGEFSDDGLANELAERQRRAWQRRRATLRDTLARSIAAAGKRSGEIASLGTDRAVTEAVLAGEEFAQLGFVTDAAHAFWLAGRLQRSAGATSEAIWSLESAFEGFGSSRNLGDRARVAGELIELLRATGQPERAEAFVAQL
ncbi:hypothetical protein ACFWHR_06145 [Leucobacter sp. NPDC058333]|uniref:hypothetical protein n=1 Tax=Leucobacter sp. NPDC058333 TaxID=3346450 RepID=UPI0036461661